MLTRALLARVSWIHTAIVALLVAALAAVPVEAAAQSPAAGGAGDGAAVGEWKVTSVSQLGSLERTLVINADGTGSYETPEAKYPLRNVVMEGNHLAFDVTVSAQGQELPLHFEGDVNGDEIAGKFSNDQAGGEVATVTGKRQ
jgi:hypothetical protein